ncbi:hypothetical protein XU18_4979 [Perkinsela sp. CCAP 1560/4]|nr:hypothetical protein XU18_4979 [Perkinsela sp. CCAP 1560/4]|eukprot:KNH03639.1 hypothetical protein XU18_4979 [Perkinsela sp. CCAP 1560/4]
MISCTNIFRRGISDFLAFSITKRKEMPQVSIQECGKKMGEMWRKMGASEKMIWKQKAVELTKIRNDKIARGEIIPKAKKTNGKRKGHISGYILFTMENRKDVVVANPKLTHKEVLSKLGATWNKLSEAEKLAYKQKAAAYKK